MDMQKSKANSNTTRTAGFSAIELLITATLVTLVTGMGVMGVTRARAHVRLSGAAREYAAYIEKARMHSIRSHADDDSERAKVTINDDRASYNVTMDLDGDGDLDTRTITLPDGVTFNNVETIAFDWRGRTWNTNGGMTTSNAQVSITLMYGANSVSIDVTGSGDITVDSDVFEDSLPDVRLHVADLSSGPNPTQTPYTETATPTPTPVNDNGGGSGSSGSGSGGSGSGGSGSSGSGSSGSGSSGSGGSGSSGSGSGDVQPTPTPTPTPTPNPTPTPAPAVCTLSLNLPQLILSKDGTGTVTIGHDAGATLTINGTSSSPSNIQVLPGAQTVTGGSSASFTIKSKKTIGTYSVTFSTSCGSKTIPVIVVGISLF